MKTASAPAKSGFCNPANPPESHDRCRKGNCPCDCHTRTHVVASTGGLSVVYLRHGEHGFEDGWACRDDAERFAAWLRDTGAAIRVEVVEL